MPGWKDLKGGQKIALIGGAATAGTIGVWAYKKKSAAASAAASTQTGTFTDPAGNTCTAPDPNTGYCPGTSQDIAMVGSGDYSSPYGGSTGFGGAIGSPYGFGGLGSPLGTTTTAATNTPGSFSNNAQWAQAAITYLGELGYSTPDVTVALGLYLSGLPMTSQQASYVEQAIAVEGNPPTAVHAPQIGPMPGQGGGGLPASGNVPNVTGQLAAVGTGELETAGYKVTSNPANTGWATTYLIHSQSPTGGTALAKGGTVTINTSKIPRSGVN